MTKNEEIIRLLESELIPAMGCTEPIAICYVAAKAREVLGEMPEKIHLKCSGSIYKNARGVKIPNTNGLMGVKASAIIGVIGGDAKKELEVLANITKKHLELTNELLASDFCTVELLSSKNQIHIVFEVFAKANHVLVEIIDKHTNIIKIVKNGTIIFEKNYTPEILQEKIINSFDEILDFIETVDLVRVEKLIQSQIDYNLLLSKEGLFNNVGCGVGQLVLESANGCELLKSKAYTIAACDARMYGADKPAMSIGGSGSQGITVSLPAYIYATEKGYSKQKIIKAILLANLTFLYIKKGIGRLSAYCSGVVSAAASGAAIMYLGDAKKEEIQNTIMNIIGNASGILCDGAKFSCALKIATSLDAAFLGVNMAKKGINLCYETGILSGNFEQTITNLGTLAKEGMVGINEKMISLMYNK